MEDTTMIYYEPEFFEDYYDKFLTTRISSGFYIDPDCRADVNKTAFYNHLTYFLINQEKKYGNSYSFLPPKCSILTKQDEKDNMYIDNYKITVIQDNKAIFRLTSDQFGFSATEESYSNNKYPLTKLLHLYQKKELTEQEKVKKLITKYVKNTRTIGGSFLWPLPPEGRRKCNYNTQRGIKGYLEDRVDLTLLEIKHALDKSYDKNQHTSDILYDEYMNEKTHIQEWFKHFDSFDRYVEYFMLDSFVKNGMPINILNGEPIDEYDIKNYKEQYQNTKKGQLQNLTGEEIITMLSNLESMIVKRSKNIENAIKQYIREKGINC